MSAAFHAVACERHQQQAIFRHGGAQVRKPAQDIHARRLALYRLAGGEQNHLILRKSGITSQRIGDLLSIIVRAFSGLICGSTYLSTPMTSAQRFALTGKLFTSSSCDATFCVVFEVVGCV